MCPARRSWRRTGHPGAARPRGSSAQLAPLRRQLVQLGQCHRHRVRQVKAGVPAARGDGARVAAQRQLRLLQTALLPPKHQRSGGRPRAPAGLARLHGAVRRHGVPSWGRCKHEGAGARGGGEQAPQRGRHGAAAAGAACEPNAPCGEAAVGGGWFVPAQG